MTGLLSGSGAVREGNKSTKTSQDVHTRSREKLVLKYWHHHQPHDGEMLKQIFCFKSYLCVCVPQGCLCRFSATSVRWHTTAPHQSSSSTAPSTCRTCARRRSWWRMTVSYEAHTRDHEPAGMRSICWSVPVSLQDSEQTLSSSRWQRALLKCDH